jgi:ABC-type Zn uptake system ZnuABC Zn-binding protein ZnuA
MKHVQLPVNPDDEEEWEYNADAFKKKLAEIDEEKKLQMEENQKIRES